MYFSCVCFLQSLSNDDICLSVKHHFGIFWLYSLLFIVEDLIQDERQLNNLDNIILFTLGTLPWVCIASCRCGIYFQITFNASGLLKSYYLIMQGSIMSVRVV